jgi:excisionase family DNA binding protein
MTVEMLDLERVAELLGISTRSVRRFSDAGSMPPPVRLGKRCLWPRETIEEWVRSGCPKIRSNRGGAR